LNKSAKNIDKEPRELLNSIFGRRCAMQTNVMPNKKPKSKTEKKRTQLLLDV